MVKSEGKEKKLFLTNDKDLVISKFKYSLTVFKGINQ